jgi:hypothetical protein
MPVKIALRAISANKTAKIAQNRGNTKKGTANIPGVTLDN